MSNRNNIPSLSSDSQQKEMKEVKGGEKREESKADDKLLINARRLETSLPAFYCLQMHASLVNIIKEQADTTD